jgi:hypothetical protein
LVATLGTASRARAFAGYGIKTTTEEGKIANPVDVIVKALEKTKADPIKFKALFASSIGARPAEALAGIYRGAGGGAAGAAAVRAKVAEYAGGGISQDEIAESVGRANNTTAARAQRFQNTFDVVVERVQSRLLPALEKAEPAILKFAEVIGDVATWAVDNPKQAIAAAIGLSIARAGIESTLRAGIERVINGQGGNRSPMVGNVVGNIGAAMTIASLAVATIQVGKMFIDWWGDKEAEGQKKDISNSVSAFNDLERAKALAAGGDTEGALKAVQTAIASDKEAKAGILEKQNSVDLSPWLRAIGDMVLGSGKGVGGIREQTGTTDAEILEAKRARDAVEKQSLKNVEAHQASAVELLRQLNALIAGGITTRDEGGGNRPSQL